MKLFVIKVSKYTKILLLSLHIMNINADGKMGMDKSAYICDQLRWKSMMYEKAM
jgi:hypothetical protein